jgi:hypothetical protein
MTSLESIMLTSAVGALAFFGARLVNSVDKLRDSLEELSMTMTEKYVKKEDFDVTLDELDEAMDTKIEICMLKHCNSRMKEIA